ncbi:hypothetical protein PMY56_02115 [Clostridium tertium]|uniref:hypothetical protein n=1 Tax=Clostridium tertium TaxID=1559 RepID=UPI00232C6469|nr:hypothetical protein [Clostridium tertium]MDB1921725.1 hypothetical protein [Clostridium tertium]MDB1924928.1 hypothetical protein [Clostridium tertium]MDB1929567.1 hypothetical protein [Clostridium tertium]
MENKKRVVISFIVLLISFFAIYLIYGRENLGNTPRDIVYKFLTSDTIEEKIEYVDEASQEDIKILEDKLTDLSRDFKKHKFNYVLEQDVNWEEVKEGEYTRIKLFKNDANGIYEDNIEVFYLKKHGELFKIDFKPVVEKNYTNLNNFILTNDKNKVFKVYAKMDNYNNKNLFNISKNIEEGELSGEKENYIPKEDLDKINKYYSVTIKDPETNIEIQGVMEKGDKDNEYSARYLDSVGFKQIIVELSNIDIDKVNKVVRIEAIKSLSWAMEE